jgi:hypothetical protein
MRVSSFAVARPTYYDRNGTSIVKAYQAYGIAPHAEVQRWIYTAPAGEKAYVEMLQTMVYRQTVAGVASRYWSEMFFTPSGGSATKILEVTSQSNVVDTQSNIIIAGSMLLFPGDSLEGQTADASTGGTTYVIVSAKFTQFDA